MKISISFLSLLILTLIASCSFEESDNKKKSLNIPESKISSQLGTLGYEVQKSNNETKVIIKHADLDLNDSQLTYSTKNNNPVIRMSIPNSKTYKIELDQTNNTGSITVGDRQVSVSKNSGSWKSEFSERELMNLAVMLFAYDDIQRFDPNTIDFQEISNSKMDYFSCKESFVQGGWRKSAVKNSVRDEANQYTQNEGCTSSAIIGDVDCACIAGDFFCICITTYILEGCACKIKL